MRSLPSLARAGSDSHSLPENRRYSRPADDPEANQSPSAIDVCPLSGGSARAIAGPPAQHGLATFRTRALSRPRPSLPSPASASLFPSTAEMIAFDRKPRVRRRHPRPRSAPLFLVPSGSSSSPPGPHVSPRPHQRTVCPPLSSPYAHTLHVFHTPRLLLAPPHPRIFLSPLLFSSRWL